MKCCGSNASQDEPMSSASTNGSTNSITKMKFWQWKCPCIQWVNCCGRSNWRLTVEPVVLLYMLPTFMLLPLLQDLIYIKVCQSLYQPFVCSRLNETENSQAMTAVQAHSAHWIQASTITVCLPSMIVGQILGTYSDTKGRKMPLLLPPLGGVLASLVYVLLSGGLVQLDVSFILLASFLTGLGGGWAGCLNTSASYLTQISPVTSRTPRVGVMECMSLLGGVGGLALVSSMKPLYATDKLFTFILALHAANVLYILAVVPSLHASRTVSRLSPSERQGSEGGGQGLLMPTWRRLKQMFGVVCRARHESRKTYLLLVILAAAVILFCTTGQLDILYLFLKNQPLNWSLEQYSRFSAILYGLGLASLILIMLPLSRVANDAVLLLVGAASRLTCLLLLGLANTDTLVYTAAVAGCAFSWSMPAIRSAMSKLVEPDELGRVFGLLGIVENACTLLASSVFASLYPLTREAHRGAVFLGAAGVMLVPVIVACALYRPLKRLASYSSMECDDDEDTSSPAGLPSDPVSSTREPPAALSLDSTAPPLGGRAMRSLSNSSSGSSASTPITPITPPSVDSLAMPHTHFPEIVDTNFSTPPPPFYDLVTPPYDVASAETRSGLGSDAVGSSL